MKKPSNRLSIIAGAVPEGAALADIGTDHGYLPIYLSLSGRIKKAIACDIGQKPLEVARKNVKAAAVNGIELRLSDGFAAISPDEINCAVIAGIGGEVISGIIGRCEWIKSSRYTLVLQPTTSPEKLREFLALNGFSVEKEVACFENEKLYSVMQVKYSGSNAPLSPEELYIGKLTATDEYGRMYIEKQLKRITKLANGIKGVAEKQNDYIYYRGIAEKIKQILEV